MNPNKNEDEKLAGFKPTNTAGGDFENKVDNSLKPSVGINSNNPDRRELALKESWGHSSLINNNAANFASESNLYKKDSGDNSKTGKIKSLTSGSVKKKITMAFAGIFGSGAIGLIVMVIIMLSTGFGIKQVAIVIRNFEFYKIYRCDAEEARPRPVRHRADGAGREPGHGRLLARRGRLLGRGRSHCPSGARGHHRGAPARHVQGHRRRRRRCLRERGQDDRLDPRGTHEARGQLTRRQRVVLRRGKHRAGP